MILSRDEDGLNGIVESRVYLGAKAEYLVRVNDQVLQVVQWNPVAEELFEAGQLVSLKLPTSGVQLLPAAWLIPHREEALLRRLEPSKPAATPLRRGEHAAPRDQG